MAFMLERHDHAKPIMRSVARELLSSCVLRSIMTFFTPYTVNKAGCWPFDAQSLPAASIHCQQFLWSLGLCICAAGMSLSVSQRFGMKPPA